MDPGPEKMFDQLGMTYEDHFRHNPGLHKTIDTIIEKLPANSRILDAGCGTGKPVALKFAQAGHEVHGFDVSQEMVDLASSQVKGHFVKSDMLEYQPQKNFDAIVASFSLYQLSHDEIHSLLYRFSKWLRPGGLLMVSTSLAEDEAKDPKLYDRTGECVRHILLKWMTGYVDSTLYTKKGWMDLFNKAGLEFEWELHSTMRPLPPYEAEEQYLVITRKTDVEALMGPYPLPTAYPGPHPLSEAAWKPFAERLARDEFDDILGLLQNNKKVLDVGSGHGKLPIELARRSGKAYSVEPNVDRAAIQKAQAANEGVELAHGTAEALPYADASFDAVVAMWILHYVNDLEKALHEMARVANRSSAHSRIIIAQGAPDNQVINMLNNIGAPLSKNPNVDHQGYLLHKAAEIFTQHGFADISVHQVDAYCQFPEEDLSERCARAAEVLAGFWYLEDPNYEQIKQALIPELELHFRDRPHAVGDQVAVLVAKPLAN